MNEPREKTPHHQAELGIEPTTILEPYAAESVQDVVHQVKPELTVTSWCPVSSFWGLN